MMNIPKNLKDFDRLVKHPFCIFEKKNFLDDNLYRELFLNFPKEEYFPAVHVNGNKKFLNNKHKEFFKFIRGNVWENFYEMFNSKKVCFLLINLIKDELYKIENRQNLKKLFFIKDYSNNIINNTIYKILKNINLDLIRVGFEFSIMKSNSFIPPHCDTENKILSLMIYFPPEDELYYASNYEKLGTNFYRKKDNQEANFDIWKSQYLDNNNSKNFFENYELFYNSKFERNKLTGFIKTNKSWHDVKKFEENLLRKSLNINLYLV